MNSVRDENAGDSDTEEGENLEASICCLIEENKRCNRAAGLASFSKRIQTKIQRKLKLSLDLTARSQFICDFHKIRIQTARNSKRQRPRTHDDSDSESDSK